MRSAARRAVIAVWVALTAATLLTMLLYFGLTCGGSGCSGG